MQVEKSLDMCSYIIEFGVNGVDLFQKYFIKDFICLMSWIINKIQVQNWCSVGGELYAFSIKKNIYNNNKNVNILSEICTLWWRKTKVLRGWLIAGGYDWCSK